MDNELMFFKIVPRHAIWGDQNVTQYFGYPTPPKTGQVWAFSAQDDGTTICQNGRFKGKGLKEIWHSNPELFNSKQEKFPFIISLVAPADNLSVQVHPTDEIANQMGYKHGKDEAWVLLKTAPNSSLIYGSKENVPETIQRIANKDFKELFNSIPTHKGDFFYIPSGTIHGLGKGNIAYEIQQSTDVTLRVYDYERLENGKPRHLDVKEGIASIKNAPPEYNTSHKFMRPKPVDLIKTKDVKIHEFIHNKSFTITRITVNGRYTLTPNTYWLSTIAKGSGNINGTDVKFADNFIVPANSGPITLEGDFDLLVTSEDHVISLERKS